ncbi:HlyD family secretion protein [Leisingera daeponensis]|uniref:HlyD family secretion protein n=1 Tax=Leisingera daeponensis TaxID=405746 RepID=A0ABS7NKU6_9RHOB|nr:HlyD family secretion protein [Leisingera daeponensis]MBY6141837.1 HlyD family secretion protein [Leisingera daeponensis]
MIDTPAPRATEETGRRESAGLRVVIAMLIFSMIGAGIWYGYRFFSVYTPYARTNNANVDGDITWIGPRIPGYAIEILVSDNERVSPGQALVQIDPRDLQDTLREAEAGVAQAQSAISQNDADRDLLHADILVAEADLEAARGTLERVETDYARAEELRNRGAGTEQTLDQRRAELIEARSSVDQATARLEFQKTRTRVIEVNREKAEADLQAALAAADTARQRLEDTRVWAPIAGRVSARNIRLGEYVNTGQRLLAITPENRLWITANYTETMIGRMKPGDRAMITVDALPDAIYCATVESISAASGANFALIPPDNATGNFTKVVRRFPVRLILDPDQEHLDQLRVGMSVSPTVAFGSNATGRSSASVLSNLLYWRGRNFACETDVPVGIPALHRLRLPADADVFKTHMFPAEKTE